VLQLLASVDDLPAVEIRQAMQNPFSNLSQNLLTRSTSEALHLAVYAV
jgi:hypothetical protein